MGAEAKGTGSAKEDGLSPSAKRVLLVLIFGGLAAILDSTIVAIALHQLTVALGTSAASIQWVSTAYLLALAVAIPTTGWAQARFGGKRVWLGALLLFVLASAACATSWNGASLVAFRAVQGFGAGLIFPLMQTLAMQAVGTKVSSRVMGRAVATITMPLALGPIIAPILGGVILDRLDWRWLFLVNVPLVAVGLVLAWRVLPDDRPLRRGAGTRLDVVGLVLLAPALVGLLLGLSNAASSGSVARTDVLVPFVVGVGLLGGFLVWAMRRRDRALIDIALLRSRSLASSSAVLFAAGAAMYAGIFLLPLYWQELRGEGVLAAAFLLIPQGVGALAARPVAALLTGRFGAPAVTVAAFVLTAVATVPFAFADARTSLWWLGIVLAVRGLGIGAVLIPPMMVAYLDLDSDEVPQATMITRIAQQVGASFGIAIVALALQTLLRNGSVAGFQGAFWWTIAITLVAVVPALLFRRPAAQPGGSESPAV